MYFYPQQLAPLIGPASGDTEVAFYIPTDFPIFNPVDYYDYQTGVLFSAPTDSIIVRWRQQSASSSTGFSDYQEFAKGMLESSDAPSVIYAYTPPLQAGIFSVSISINGRDFWPPDDYAPSGNCTFETSIGRKIKGDCISDTDTCLGYSPASGSFVSSLTTCSTCCITDTSFRVYQDFDISSNDGAPLSGYSSGYDPLLGAIQTHSIKVCTIVHQPCTKYSNQRHEFIAPPYLPTPLHSSPLFDAHGDGLSPSIRLPSMTPHLWIPIECAAST